MRYTNIEKLIVRILSSIAIISFLILAISNFLVGVPLDIKPIFFAIGYAKVIISLQIIFLHVVFLSLIVIAFYNVKWIIVCITKKEKKSLYILSLFVLVIYIILYYPYYSFTSIPIKTWYVLNFFGCIYIFVLILLSDKTHIPLKSIDNRVFTLDYVDHELHGIEKNGNIIFSKIEILLIYILSFLIIVGFIFFEIRLLYITKVFHGLSSISFNLKHHYIFSIFNPEYLLDCVLFICFIGLLYFSLKGLWKGCIIYNLKKTIYIFPSFILPILAFIVIYFPNYYIFPFTILIWHFIHLIGISLVIFLVYVYVNGFYKFPTSEKALSIKNYVISFSKRERKYILVCTSMASVFSLFYMIVHVTILIVGIKFMFIFSQPHLLPNLLWLVSYPSIVILIYFNIKALGQLKNDRIRSKIRINLYITIFYLIAYIPIGSVFQIGNAYWFIIEALGGVFFFFSAYFFLLRKHSTVSDESMIFRKKYKREIAQIMNTKSMPSEMRNIIKVFKNEHKIIMGIISLIKRNDDIFIKHKEFLSMKAILIKHLEKEKQYLYLPFLDSDRVDEKLNKVLKIFISNMEKTGKQAMSFYNRHEVLKDRKGFLDGLDKFSEELAIRIMKEENIFEEYVNFSIDCTDSLKGKTRYSKFEKVNIYLTALIGVIFFIILTREIFYINLASYTARHNFSSPDNYFTIVIFVSLVILLYFLVKGFYISCKHNLPKRLCYFIILTTALIVYLFLYWPGLVEPPISRLGWNVIHMIGIVLILCIVLFTGNKKESTNIISSKHYIRMNPKGRFSEKDIKYLFLLTLLCVILSFSCVVVDIFGALNLLDYSYIYRYFSILNPFVDALIIYFCAIIILFFYTIKGVVIGKKKKMGNKFIIKSFIIIIMLIVYFPTSFTYLKPLIWIVIDSISLSFFVAYLMYTSIND